MEVSVSSGTPNDPLTMTSKPWRPWWGGMAQWFRRDLRSSYHLSTSYPYFPPSTISLYQTIVSEKTPLVTPYIIQNRLKIPVHIATNGTKWSFQSLSPTRSHTHTKIPFVLSSSQPPILWLVAKSCTSWELLGTYETLEIMGSSWETPSTLW